MTGAGNTNISGQITGSGATTYSGFRGDYFASAQLPAAAAPADLGQLTHAAFDIDGHGHGPDGSNQLPEYRRQFLRPYANVGGQNVAARWTGTFTVATAGTYNFETGSDDERDPHRWRQVVNNDFSQGVTFRSGSVSPECGHTHIDIEYFQGGSGGGMLPVGSDRRHQLQFIPASAISFQVNASPHGQIRHRHADSVQHQHLQRNYHHQSGNSWTSRPTALWAPPSVGAGGQRAARWRSAAT